MSTIIASMWQSWFSVLIFGGICGAYGTAYIASPSPAIFAMGVSSLMAALVAMTITYYSCAYSLYLGEVKGHPVSEKLKILLFSKGEYSFIISHSMPDWSINRFIEVEHHYLNDPNAFVNMTTILIPFTNKNDALKWKMQDPNSHLFTRVSDINWQRGIFPKE